ncbi:MAG: hypothetical protein D6731_11800 [Planctomycetota bacterium]|nr:MAG: hypothetical protein D6731_11800 [Planctomycetota bacterium]
MTPPRRRRRLRFRPREEGRVLRPRVVAAAALITGGLWFVEGLLVGERRWLELLLALALAYNAWRRAVRARAQDEEDGEGDAPAGVEPRRGEAA